MVHFLVTWNFLDKLHQNKLGKFSKLPFSVSFFLLTDLLPAWLMKIQIMQAGLVRSVCPRKVLQQFQTSMSDCLVLESWLCVPSINLSRESNLMLSCSQMQQISNCNSDKKLSLINELQHINPTILKQGYLILSKEGDSYELEHQSKVVFSRATFNKLKLLNIQPIQNEEDFRLKLQLKGKNFALNLFCFQLQLLQCQVGTLPLYVISLLNTLALYHQLFIQAIYFPFELFLLQFIKGRHFTFIPLEHELFKVC